MAMYRESFSKERLTISELTVGTEIASKVGAALSTSVLSAKWIKHHGTEYRCDYHLNWGRIWNASFVRSRLLLWKMTAYYSVENWWKLCVLIIITMSLRSGCIQMGFARVFYINELCYSNHLMFRWVMECQIPLCMLFHIAILCRPKGIVLNGFAVSKSSFDILTWHESWK